MACWLASWSSTSVESAAAACAFASSECKLSSSTSGAMPPASAIRLRRREEGLASGMLVSVRGGG